VLTVLAGPAQPPEYGDELKALGGGAWGLRTPACSRGWWGGQEKLSLYQSADVMVVLSGHENFSLVILEAMCCGTPVVTTRGHFDSGRTCRRGGGGRLIADSDQELDQAVLSIVKDSDGGGARCPEEGQGLGL